MQECPVAPQFFVMDLSPRLYKPLLRFRETAADAFNRIKREDRPDVLIRRVKVRTVMGSADFHEHPNDDSEESRNLWHAPIVFDCAFRDGLTRQMSRAPAAIMIARYRLARWLRLEVSQRFGSSGTSLLMSRPPSSTT